MTCLRTTALVCLVTAVTALWASGADKPTAVVEGTQTRYIVARGDVVFAAQSGGMVTHNVKDPLRPRPLGWLSLPATVRDIVLEGPLAFLAAGRRGVVVVDISDTATPRELARLDTDGTTERVLTHGRWLYLADGTNGLLVVDRETLDDPRIVTRISTSGDLRAIAIHGELLAVAESHGGARVFDIHRPDNPRERVKLETPFAARDLCWVGDRLLVAGGQSGVAVYRPSEGSRAVATLPALPSAQYLACADELVAVSNTGSALQLFDLAPDEPVERAHLRIHRSAPIGRSSFDGAHLWIAVDLAGLGLLDVTDPADPQAILPARRRFNVNF